MRIAPLDRIAVGDAWTLRTDGRRGVITLGTTDGPTVQIASEGMRLDVAAWMAAPFAPADLARLLAVVTPFPCGKCKGQRLTKCTRCHGEGERNVRCEQCDDVHRCICDECDKGMATCECYRPRAVVLFGFAYNAWLVHQLLLDMRVDPARPFEAADIGVRNGEGRRMLAVRQGATVGVVMPMAFNDDEVVDAPRWPVETVAQEGASS